MATSDSSFSLNWNKSFEVGHERIDFEHQIFLGLIKKLADIEVNSASEFNRYLIELKKYAEFHFISEENIMLDCSYPDYNEHKKLHNNLIKDLDHHINRYDRDKLQPGEFVAFLYEWFIHHTMVEDLKISSYIDSQS